LAEAQMKPLLLPAILLATLACPCPAAQPDTLSLPIVAAVQYSRGRPFPCGDADHDGHREFYSQSSPSGSLFVHEHVGNNSYFSQALFPMIVPYDIGDADADGRADLVGFDLDSRWIVTVESPDSRSFPSETTRVADTHNAAAIYGARISDLDQDSMPEILYSDWARVAVHEAVGDNEYDSVASLIPPSDQVYCFSWGDADQDGRMDVAMTDLFGLCPVFECTGDNQYEMVAVCTTDIWGPRWAEITDDMDRDGRREIVIYGNEGDDGFIEVFECAGDNTYPRVWRLDLINYWQDDMAVGDIEGDGQQEFAIYDGWDIILFKCVGDDEYAEAWRSHEEWTSLALADVNGNGRDELIHLHDFGDSSLTVLREYQPAAVEASPASSLRGVEVSPSVLRPGAGLHLSGLPPDARVELLDVSGRVCSSSDLSFVLGTSSLRPGAYFVRITAGSQSITRKLLVVE
jgi:hypothetical protein